MRPVLKTSASSSAESGVLAGSEMPENFVHETASIALSSSNNDSRRPLLPDCLSVLF